MKEKGPNGALFFIVNIANEINDHKRMPNSGIIFYIKEVN